LEAYKENKQSGEGMIYTIEQYKFLKDDMLSLYRHLEKRVLNIDSSVRVEFKKLYIAFKSQTNFVDVIPNKNSLRLSLNMEFDKIKDPKGICKNISGLGRWGNGDVEVGIDSLNGLDYVMELVTQAFEQQVELM
jgi:predicted transport protein